MLFRSILLGAAFVLLGFCFFQFYSPLFKINAASESQPFWMMQQIQEDLSPFSAEGIKKSDLYVAMQMAPPKMGFLHVKLQSGKVSFSGCAYFSSSERTRSKHVKKFFLSLAKRYRLPDVEFIICLLDALDERKDPLIPLFVFAKKDSSECNVLFPDFEALQPTKRLAQYKRAIKAHAWSSKKETVFWRGATTGGNYELGNYLQFPRVKLVFMSKESPDKVDAAFSVLCQSAPLVLETILQRSRPLAPYASIPDHFAYKYLIDIDGNSCTYERCRWILLSNSTLLKPVSHNAQWYYKALQPYKHYVPLKEDLSDLLSAYDWLKNHDKEARAIADEGRDLGLTLFSPEAIQTYVATLLLEYSKLYRPTE